jgi:hypothetical protein
MSKTALSSLPETSAGAPQGASPGVPTGELVGLGFRDSEGVLSCALCKAEMEWQECSACGGDGFFDGYEEDPNWYQPGECVDCSQCAGQGGDYWCPTDDCKTFVCTRIVKPNVGSQPRAERKIL